jgi:Putative transmembrane protein (Alph_Pro_TM)
MHFIESAKADVNVEQVGVVKSLADMAKNNGGLYGIFSIVAAPAAGFGVSMVFKNVEVHTSHVRVAPDKKCTG